MWRGHAALQDQQAKPPQSHSWSRGPTVSEGGMAPSTSPNTLSLRAWVSEMGVKTLPSQA